MDAILSMPRDPIDDHDPRRALEEFEDSVEERDNRAMKALTKPGDELRHVFAWILEGKTLVAVATRCYVAAYVGVPESVQGLTLHQIAALSGKGRSATHNLAREFEEVFGVKSIHARSDVARANYSKAFHQRNGTKPHAYNPTRK